MAEAPSSPPSLPLRNGASNLSVSFAKRAFAPLLSWFLSLSQTARLTIGGAALLLLITVVQQAFTLQVSGQNIAFSHIASLPSGAGHQSSGAHGSNDTSAWTSGDSQPASAFPSPSQVPVRQQLENLKLQEQKLLQLLKTADQSGALPLPSTAPAAAAFSASDVSLRKGRCRAHNLTQYRFTAVTTRFKPEENWEIDLWAGAMRCQQIPRFDEVMPTAPPDAPPDAPPPQLPCPGEPGWAYDEYRVPVRIYDKTLRPAAYTAPNVGREEMGYLSYIVDFYDCLPAYSLFLHPEGGRNRGLHNWLQCLRPDAAPGALTSAGLPWMSLVDLVVVRDMSWASRTLWRLNEAALAMTGRPILPLNEDGSHPDFGVVTSFCCAEFVIPRESIHAYPRAFWEFALNMAVDTFMQGEIGFKAPVVPSRLPLGVSPSTSKTSSPSLTGTASRTVTASASESASATASVSPTRSSTSSLSPSPSVDENRTAAEAAAAAAGGGGAGPADPSADGGAEVSGEAPTPPPLLPDTPPPPQSQQEQPPPNPAPSPPAELDTLLEGEEAQGKRDYPTGLGTADLGHSVSYHWEFMWGLLFEHSRWQRNYTRDDYCLLFRDNCTGSPCFSMPAIHSWRRQLGAGEQQPPLLQPPVDRFAAAPVAGTRGALQLLGAAPATHANAHAHAHAAAEAAAHADADAETDADAAARLAGGAASRSLRPRLRLGVPPGS